MALPSTSYTFLSLAPVTSIPAVSSATPTAESPIASPIDKVDALSRQRTGSADSGRFLVLNPVTVDL